LRQVAASDLLAGITVETDAHYGPAAPTILAEATAHTVDLIVMECHGYTGITRWMLGSIAEEVIRSAPIPVLVWHVDAAFPQTSVSYIESPLRVLVPLDGSAYADAALEPKVHFISQEL